MATITLRYNPNNSIAEKTINYILSLGLFEKMDYSNPFTESDDDIKNGRVYETKNADDLISQCLEQ